MDKVDAKTRETAATLLDVLWTSKSGGEIRPSPDPASTMAKDQSTAVATSSVKNFNRNTGLRNGFLFKTPPATTLRHGFDTTGWGNDPTLKRPPSTQHTAINQAGRSCSTEMTLNHDINTSKKSQNPDYDTQTMLQLQQTQQPQSQSRNTMASSSSSSMVPNTLQSQNYENRNQEMQMKEQQFPDSNKNQPLSTKSQHCGFVGANHANTSGVTSNATMPMMISMTSIGLGIDNSNTSREDATEATIKAVKDAMERSALRFQTAQSHSLQIKIQLGVPPINKHGRTLGGGDSEMKQNNSKTRSMNIDIARLSSVLPREIPILPVQVDLGGLLVPGETAGAPSICTVVACITLESQTQPPPPRSQLQLQPSPRVAMASPLPMCQSIALETSTSCFPKPKQAMAMTSAPSNNMMQAPSQVTEVQHHQQIYSQILPTPTPKEQQHLVADSIPPQRAIGKSNHDTSQAATLPSPTLLCKKGVARPVDKFGTFGNKSSEKNATPASLNNNSISGGTSAKCNVQHHQEQKDGDNHNPQMTSFHQGINGGANSIEILAMISEQEINRRNVVGSNGTSTPPASRSKVLAATATADTNFCISSDVPGKSGGCSGTVIAEELSTEGESRYFKSENRVIVSESSVAAARQNVIQTLDFEQSNDNTERSNNNDNRQFGGDIILKTENTFASSGTINFETSGVYKTNNGAGNNSTFTAVDPRSKTTMKPTSVRQPPNPRSRQSIKPTGSRSGGRTISYSDYSNERPLPEERDCWALSTRTTSSPVFPLKLHETLTQIEKDGYDHIIGWLPHGRSFKIHKQKEFTDIILPRYFVMTKKSSFLRQLNLYSFNRFSAGTTDKGSYYHEKFLRGKKFLSRRMTRQKVNGNRIRSAGNPDEEPDLSRYPVCRDDDRNSKNRLSQPPNPPSPSSSIATSAAAGRSISSTGDKSRLSSNPSSQSSMIRAPTSSVPEHVGGAINNRNPAVGTSPFLRVL